MPQNIPPIPPGKIDVHSHIIPNIDDGSKSLDETIQVIQLLIQRGFIGSICTPHYHIDMYPDNTPQIITKKITDLKAQLALHDINYHLWQGGELAISPLTTDLINTHGIATLANSKYVLFDIWVPSDHLHNTCDLLFSSGYTPILAHPERIVCDDDTQWLQLIDQLISRGVLLQGNFISLTGFYGNSVAARIRRLLRENKYFLLATDAHGTRNIDERLEGLAIAEVELGPEIITQLTDTNPRKIITQQ